MSNCLSVQKVPVELFTKDIFLLRYVKPAYINMDNPTDESLQLREDRLPPEEYLSFYQSTEATIEKRYRDLIAIMTGKKYRVATNSGILHLNSEDVDTDINRPRKLVEFRDCGSPHYGLFFCSNNELDIHEAKTALLFLADFELTRNIIEK